MNPIDIDSIIEKYIPNILETPNETRLTVLLLISEIKILEEKVKELSEEVETLKDEISEL